MQRGFMAKKTLTDRTLKALEKRPAEAGKTYDVADGEVQGLYVRVMPSGTRSFVYIARYPGRKNPTRRSLGKYGRLTLEQAREKAREWHALIDCGVDPRDDIKRKRLAEQRKQENSFRAVAEEFIRLAVVRQRKNHQVQQDLEREFISKWGGRPITEITQADIVRVLDAVVKRGKDERNRPAVHQAHNLLGHIRRLFNWAISRGIYGLDRSPCDRMKPRDVIGEKTFRTRVLKNAELRALWNAAERMGYPYGPLYKMLALTGQRKSEVAEARWSEFDLNRKLWVIPAERMKMDAPHTVPLSDEVLAILKELPRFSRGDCLFTTTFGAKPVNDFSHIKTRLDELMLLELETLPPFVIHDIRRTMRTGLSALPVPPDVAELVIAHARPGLRKVYDMHSFEAEKRRALELWAGHLRDIVSPPPANVIKLAHVER
jgi:integrase